MPDVLLVVDMLDGFLTPGRALYCGDGARAIIPRVRALIERELARGSRIIFIHDTHDPDDREFEMFPPHCIRGTQEAELIPELADLPGEHLRKRRYSAFFETDLDERLREASPSNVMICGVCTDICVLHTAADARNRDYRVEIDASCVASFDPAAHAWALQHARRILGVHVVGMEEPVEA